MGQRLRHERQAHGLSLRDLAARLGVSPSLISQVETGRASPSVSTLYAIANELDVSLDDLLFDGRRAGGHETGVVPTPPEAPAAGRADPLEHPATRSRIHLASGVIWERLTTASEPGIDFLYVTYEVGGASSPEGRFQRHDGHEWGYVISGALKVTIQFDEFLMHAGDSISYDSTVPHRLENAGEVPVHAVWFQLGRQPIHELSTLAREVARDVAGAKARGGSGAA